LEYSMTPAEAARAIESARTIGSGRARLRLVGSVDNPDAGGPGARLQGARRDADMSVHQIAQALKLKPEQVAAIESMQFSKLPGLGYALGYVRAYAELLDLADCDGVVQDFKDAWAPEQSRREQEKAVTANRFSAPIGIVLALGAVAWILVWAAAHGTTTKIKTEAIAPPDESIKAWAQTKPAVTAKAVADVRPLAMVKALRDTPITLRGEDGALVASRMLRKDEEISTDGLGRWFVSTPFGGALEAHGYGEVALIGEPGLKVENWRVPDFEAIAQEKAKAAALLLAEEATKAKAEADAKAVPAPQ
jgi:Helix-turn-helix domain